MAGVATLAQRKKHKDPYALAQAQQRKDANLSRRAALTEERKIAMGDPVRGVSTPFLESFDTVGASVPPLTPKAGEANPEGTQITGIDDVLLNHFLTPKDLEYAIEHSRILSEPVVSKIRDDVDPAIEEEAKRKHEEGHARASVALARIVSLANASQKDKTRANIVRCIDKFGRHNTSKYLDPPLKATQQTKSSQRQETPRAGPDTGSSEVQIAIMTAKIRVLADQLEAKGGKKDKINKRNLRVMVHKRQKLLKYLRRKEHGGSRWKHLVETLGLTEGTWQGEISL